MFTWRFQWTLLLLLFWYGRAEILDLKCDRSPLQVILVFDVTVSNVSQFREQQVKLIDTLRHLDKVTKGRELSYALIAFHRLAVSLTSLNEGYSKNLNKVIDQIENLNPRYHLEKSAVRALHTALDQITNNGQDGVQTLVFLTHSDGITSDSLLDVLSVRSKLAFSANATIFALSTTDQSPINSLLHFTNSKERIYTSPNDLPVFFNSIDSTINACLDDVQPNGIPTHKVFGVKNSISNVAAECTSNQVDLMILLDTSGSIQRTFEREQNLAVELINGLSEDSFGANLQVSVIQFAAEPTVVVGFRQHANKQRVLGRLRDISFTGRITRIAKAIEYGLKEMEENGKPNSTRIIVLITDGNSLDYWHDVKRTGSELRHSNAAVFVASTSSEINFDEMLIYSGSKERIFLGTRDKIFPLTVSSLVERCLNGNELKNTIRLENTINSKLVLNEQFLSLQQKPRDAPNKENRVKELSTGTLPNDAQPSKSLFTKVTGRKDESPSTQANKKHFDDQSAKNLFNELNNDEIIANTTEIDEFEGSGQEIKAEEEIVQLVSSVSSHQEKTTLKVDNKTANCNYDLLFIVEASEKLNAQLNLTAKIIDRIPEALISSQIRLSLVLITRTSTKALLNMNSTKSQFLDSLNDIKSSDENLELNQVIKKIQSNGRSNSQLISLFLFEVDNQKLLETFNKLNPRKTLILGNTPITKLNDNVNYISNAQDFSQQTIDLLLSCISASVEQNFNEFIAGQKTQSILTDVNCENDPIDLFVVLSPLSTPTYDTKIRLFTNFIRQLSVAEFMKRIRVSITLYTNEGQLVIPLRSALAKDDVLLAIEQIKRNESHIENQSLVAGLKTALTDILPAKRPRARLIGLLIVDENPKDNSDTILDVYQTLKSTQSDVNLLALNESLDFGLLAQYVGGNISKIHNQMGFDKFFADARNNLFGCQIKTHAKSEDDLHNDVFEGKDLFRRSDNTIEQQSDQNSSEPAANSTNSSNCNVDLILVIDTSTSVELEYNNQLQYATDLIKHLPDHDIESGRIQVGIVSFYAQAKTELSIGSLQQRQPILDTITNIKHTGGSTFIANGIKQAIELMKKRNRPTAQLAVVLISDGNSQDEWVKVLETSSKLRLLHANVYALTASREFSFRELEIYADKNVYTNGEFEQFLKQIDSSILAGCPAFPPFLAARDERVTKTIQTTNQVIQTTKAPTTPSTKPAIQIKQGECTDDLVDLFILLDTSTATSNQFYAQKSLTLNLLKVLPLNGKRIQVALAEFNSTFALQLDFSSNQAEILKHAQRINYTAGNTSLVVGINGAIKEIESYPRRQNSRLVLLVISDGNSQDDWTHIQKTAKKLRQLNKTEVYAATLSNAYYFDELREYTEDEKHIYADEKVENFIQDIGQLLIECNHNNNVSSQVITSTTKVNNEFAARDESLLKKNNTNSVLQEKEECKFAKIDLILILDASTSRESVFEHQRELALSLIERLPISRGDTHVSIGLNSFVHVPTMRLTLGLGRDRTMVRKAIEEIEFKGGSTLTSQAIELAISDLEKGRRRDATQVIVLMNDGMSQDNWETVQAAAEKLSKTKAELFGVALGENVDLRELQLYIKRKERIYRDGASETERFLQDVVSLLRNDTNGNCPLFFSDPEEELTTELPSHQMEELCEKPKLDMIVLFDNSDSSEKMSDPKLNSNRYLLLDVLGSLPLGSQVNVAVFSFAQTPHLEFDLTSEQEREVLFEKVEAIQPRRGQPSYATAVQEALAYYKRNKRINARGFFLIVGDGQNSTDRVEDRSLTANQLRRTNGLLCQAVDSGKEVDLQTLIAYTSSIGNVFNYDRNAEFAKNLLQLATAVNGECGQTNTPTSTEPPLKHTNKDLQPLKSRDITVAEGSNKSLFFGDTEKLLKRPKTTKPIVPVKLTNITSNCLVDLMLIIDTSGSVNETIEHAKRIAVKVLDQLNIGSNASHVSIVKFSAKARTLYSFGDAQSKDMILKKLSEINLSSGTTAIHAGLLQAISEYTSVRGARLNNAQALAIIFTDGFGQKDMSVEAELLREVSSLYAIGINHEYPVSRKGLELITADSKRVFTDANIDDFYLLLQQKLAKCQ